MSGHVSENVKERPRVEHFSPRGVGGEREREGMGEQCMLRPGQLNNNNISCLSSIASCLYSTLLGSTGKCIPAVA